MDTRKLYYFTQIVDYGSISRAADFLNIAQPALSRHMASLEKEFGHQLLLRGQNGVSATLAGESLYRSAQSILHIERATLRQITRMGEDPSGLVTLGIGPYNCANGIAVSVISKVLRNFPGISVHCVENLSSVFSKAVKMGVLDAAIIYDPGFIPGLHCEHVTTEDLYLVAHRDLRVTEPGTSDISLDSVGGLELFLPQTDTVLRQMIEQAFRSQNLDLVVRAEIESPLTLRLAVEKGLGSTCLPQSVADEIFPGHEFQKLRIVNPTVSASFVLCTPEPQFISNAANAVIRLLREEIQLRALKKERACNSNL